MNEIYAIQQYSNFEMVQDYNRDNGHRYTLSNIAGRTIGESPYYPYSYEMKRDMHLLKNLLRKADVLDNSSLVRFFRRVRI
jgi:hypothetical protein